jgi:ketosteroid isomerase-like protein
MKQSLIAMVCVAACLCLSRCDRAGKEIYGESQTQELERAVTALRGAYAAFNRGDIDAAVVPLDEHIEWSEPTVFPGGGTYHGREGARRYLSQSRASLAEGTSEPVQFISTGNLIVVFVHAHVRPLGSHDWHDIDLADVYTIRDGRIVQMRAFANRQEALRWAGAENVVPAPNSK